jgi:endonuclease I
MKRTFIIVVLLGFWLSQSYAQPTGYYNGTEGLNGDDLKTALNDIIDDHVQFSYFASKTIFKFSDVDPENPDNVVQVYTGFSHANNDWGTSGLQLNREHVWAKSHGNFADVMPMYGDVHNLKPAAASVNQDRSNKDFGNGGIQHDVATGCYFTDSTWEARDEVKGDIARIIFYMDTRYEGNNGESNLTVVDYVNTYPLPEHGRLSTLLEWNEMDPPDEFERNRNNVIFSWQKNRNPFIDNPEYANLIWGGAQVSAISFSDFANSPENPIENDVVTINASVSSTLGALTEIQLHWGLDFENLDNISDMTNNGSNNYSVDVPGQNGAQTVYYQIVASDGTNTASSIEYNYYVAPIFNGELVSIYDIQGQTDVSPYDSLIVSTTGVVTANFGDSYFIQDGPGEWNGLFVYDGGRNPSIGDSVVITGLIEEYYNKTEIKEISDYYFISANNDLPEPVVIATGDGSEPYESVLVNVNNATCTFDDYESDYFMWQVNDGSGMLKIHNTSIFQYEPVLNEAYDITGPLNYDFDEWKMELRYENDVLPGSDLIPPSVNEVEALNDSIVKLTFSENLDEVSAETSSNYSINNGIEVLDAKLHTFQDYIVFLTVSKLQSNDYTLTVENIEDMAGNVMEMEGIDFTFMGDTIPPTVSTVFAVNDTVVEVVFTEDVEELSSEIVWNYYINNGINVLEANRDPSLHSIVNLSVSKMQTGDYSITIENVKDLAGNVMEMEGIDFAFIGDIVPPVISTVSAVNDTVVEVEFSEDVDELSSETLENYFINNGINVLEAKRDPSQHSVVSLSVSKMQTGDYTITVENVKDLAGNVMEMEEAEFAYTSSGINDLFGEANISIYPNPASDYFTINIPQLNAFDKEFKLIISNIAGQTIVEEKYSVQNGEGNFEVNTSMLDKGMYIIKINSGSSYGVQKLLIK